MKRCEIFRKFYNGLNIFDINVLQFGIKSIFCFKLWYFLKRLFNLLNEMVGKWSYSKSVKNLQGSVFIYRLIENSIALVTLAKMVWYGFASHCSTFKRQIDIPHYIWIYIYYTVIVTLKQNANNKFRVLLRNRKEIWFSYKEVQVTVYRKKINLPIKLI